MSTNSENGGNSTVLHSRKRCSREHDGVQDKELTIGKYKRQRTTPHDYMVMTNVGNNTMVTVYPNVQLPVDPFFANLLGNAILCNNAEHIKMIFVHNFVYQRRTHASTTPLHIAAFFGNTVMIDMLLDSCSVTDLYARDYLGYTPLHVAIEENNVDAVRTLVCFPNFDVNVRVSDNKRPYTPLELACARNHDEIVHLLFDTDGVMVF